MTNRRVLQVVQHLQPGGIETMALDLVRYVVPGVKSHLVSLEGSRRQSLEDWPRLRALGTGLEFLGKKPGIDFRVVTKLLDVIEKRQISVVHTHHIGPLIYGGIAARIAGIKHLIHTEHDAWHLNNSKRRRLQSFATKLLRPTIVADAAMVASALRKAIPSTHPLVISNGIDTERFSPGDQAQSRRSLNLPSDKLIVGCAARLEVEKGHHTLISALSDLPENVHLALAGDGSKREQLKFQVAKHGLQQRVHFLGLLNQMPTFHRAIDVFCLASENEGLPLSPLEAQACGTPVVLTDVGGCSEAVCPVTGLLVAPGSPEALSWALCAVLKRHNKISPRAFVEKHGNLKKMATAYALLHAPN